MKRKKFEKKVIKLVKKLIRDDNIIFLEVVNDPIPYIKVKRIANLIKDDFFKSNHIEPYPTIEEYYIITHKSIVLIS